MLQCNHSPLLWTVYFVSKKVIYCRRLFFKFLLNNCVKFYLWLQTLQQNVELRRRLQKIHAESSMFGACAETRFTPSNSDVALQISMQASSNKASLGFLLCDIFRICCGSVTLWQQFCSSGHVRPHTSALHCWLCSAIYDRQRQAPRLGKSFVLGSGVPGQNWLCNPPLFRLAWVSKLWQLNPVNLQSCLCVSLCVELLTGRVDVCWEHGGVLRCRWTVWVQLGREWGGLSIVLYCLYVWFAGTCTIQSLFCMSISVYSSKSEAQKTKTWGQNNPRVRGVNGKGSEL